MNSNEWKKVKLGDLLNFRRGHDLPKANMVHGTVPVLGSNGVIGYHNASTTKAPCLTIGRSGNVGNPCFINKDCWAHNTTLYVDDFKGNNPLYLFYLLKTLNLSHYGGGSAVPTLNRNHIHPITVRSTLILSEQKAIADTLSCLDDMIELNYRTNQVLEEMAQAIFKHWFVDFEFPGNNGQPYKSSGGELVDSKLGEIPKGWRVYELSEIFEINPVRRIVRGTLAPYLEMSNMPIKGHAPSTWGNREFGSGMKFINGDTLVARITPCLENGKTAYVDFLEEDQVGWGSTEYIVLRPNPPISTVFGYILARSEQFRDYAIKRMTGSSGRQRVPADNIALFPIALPSLDNLIHESFGVIVEALFNSMRVAAQESRTLCQVRDGLLPKLMSGELRVPIEEVV